MAEECRLSVTREIERNGKSIVLFDFITALEVRFYG